MHRPTPTTKNDPAPNVSSAEVDSPALDKGFLVANAACFQSYSIAAAHTKEGLEDTIFIITCEASEPFSGKSSSLRFSRQSLDHVVLSLACYS